MADKAKKQVVVGSKTGGSGRKVSRRTVFGLLAAVVVLAVVPVAVLPAGRDYIVSTLQIGGPCTSSKSLVTEYNQTVRKDGVTQLGTVAKEVRAKKNYTSDATCMYMLTIAGYGQSITVQTYTDYAQLQKLQAAGKQVSGKVNDGIDRQGVYKLIEDIQKSNKEHTSDGIG